MMELLKLMMCKNDFLSSGSLKMDERVPPINLDNFPDFLLCRCFGTDCILEFY